MLALGLHDNGTDDAADDTILLFTLRWGVTVLYLSLHLRHNKP